jgi:hypothetical protein
VSFYVAKWPIKGYISHMEKMMNRPKNADLGKPLRSKRIPVQVSDEEHAEIEAAASKRGYPVSTWLRVLALAEARRDDN